MAEPAHDLAAYDFEYPESAVADRPAEPRDAARLLVLDRASGAVRHAVFRDLPGFLRAGDCLVLNRTKVIPSRLVGRKETGGRAEVLLVKELGPRRWSALARGLKPGGRLEFADGARALVEGLSPDGEWLLAFETDPRALMEEHGLAPLPPYIAKRGGRDGVPDRERYQTVYAREAGSIAAPTAGFHFTPEVLAAVRTAGVRVAEIILHVGPGTFRPVTAADVRAHAMLPERYEIPEVARAELDAVRGRGGRLIPVGTTATRTVETYFAGGAAAGETSLYVYPGYSFKAVDALLTNFHLPQSTPLLLACAFAGRERILAAYAEAIRAGYRLFSYGDSMLIV